MLKTTRPAAMHTPAAATAVTQANRGKDTVLSSLLTTVLSCGTFPPVEKAWMKLKNTIYISGRLTCPFLPIEPRQIVGLGVVVSQFQILSSDHLLDLGQSYSVSLRREGHYSLKSDSICGTLRMTCKFLLFQLLLRTVKAVPL
jgi:hypothetical protein